MESDDDFEQLTPLEESASSSQHQNRKLKRLKKTNKLSKSPLRKPSIDSDFSVLDKPPLMDSMDSDDLLQPESPSSEGCDEDNCLDSLDGLLYAEDRPAAKRVLTFDDFGDVFDGNEDDSIGVLGLEKENGEKKRGDSEGTNDEMDKRKKRAKRIVDKKETKRAGNITDGHMKPKISKRKEMEGRKAQIAQLADFQRQLRERRYVAFEPVPMVQKPISSVLERIRKRKKEVLEKALALNKNHHSDPLREVMMDSDPEDAPVIERYRCKYEESVSEEKTVQSAAKEPLISHSDGYNEVTKQSNYEHVFPATILNKETKHTFQAPVDDTQDIFLDSQQSRSQDDQSSEEQGIPVEGDLVNLAPSMPEINSRIDSVPINDDRSSDEEDIDKENIDPRQQQPNRGFLSPRGDPVQQFVDEEAVEEDDSDNDHMCFQDEEENLDPEELEDMIATDYKEKPIDHERRNELHQKWLEKQDEAGTENLLQKLGCGVKQTNSYFCEDEDEDEERNNNEEVEFDEDEGEEDSFPPNGARVSTRKLKQMIPQMFNDKDDGFMSSDDEETEKILKKQCLLERAGLQEEALLVPPAEDEASREVFGRIKKMNIVPETKKAKRTSFFGALLTSDPSNNSKSSFLRRASIQSMSSNHKQTSSSTSTVKSFIIFGRDDSNSRGAILASEDSSDANQRQNQQKKNATAKFSSSQARLRTQSAEIPSVAASNTSLLSVLRRSSSLQIADCARNSLVDHQAVFAALKSVKKPIKIEGRF